MRKIGYVMVFYLLFSIFGRHDGLTAFPLFDLTILQDWRRYLGLGLFVGTVAGTLLLTQWAARRRRRITTQHVWGHHLGTEQGVDALLSTGWKVRGSKMEVFNKEKAGYRDDDSILLGGYEPTAYLGAEITVTQDSNTTPEDG